MMNSNHPFHLVTLSPWPMMTSLSLMNLFMSILNWFTLNNLFFMLFNMINLLMIMYQWWRDIIRESTYQGCHTLMVLNMMKFSMILFIISELFFFISLFWTYFHSCISPNIEIGNMWPPKNILMFNPYDIPLFNSIILISSGFVITWSHNLLLNNKLKYSKFSLLITIILGMYFSLMQYLEYNEAKFCINDGIFGSIFYLLTGFHGMHVIIGNLFLMMCLLRMSLHHFSKIHHFHFEASSWYWHFVDIIWLFVYMFIYWWMY